MSKEHLEFVILPRNKQKVSALKLLLNKSYTMRKLHHKSVANLIVLRSPEQLNQTLHCLNVLFGTTLSTFR